MNSNSRNTVIDLKSRNYYWLLIIIDNAEIKACSKWAPDPQAVDLQLDLFQCVKNVCKDNKLIIKNST